MSLSSILKNSAWAIFPALLLLISAWLANTMTQKNVTLSYKASTRAVSGLHTAYIEISNHSEVAIDRVIISSTPLDAIQSSYEPLTNGSEGSESNAWEGEILAGGNLRILYVLNKEIPISASALNSLLTAEYRVRNKENGRLEWSKVNLSEDEVILSGTLIYIFWFFLPILLSFILIVIVYYGWKFFCSRHSI